jgi:hypothetical protein
VRIDFGVVISWDGENWSGIISVRIVELVVIVAVLAKIVDNVAQVVKESRSLARVGHRKVLDHLLSDKELVSWTSNPSGIAYRVKNNGFAIGLLYARLDGP